MTGRCALVPLLLASSMAVADGAFPDSFAVFAPADQPHRLLLSTNFGLLLSEDDGTSWFLVCELAMDAPYASLYQLGPAPANRIGVVSQVGLSISSDNACTWALADGGVTNTYVEDFFFDPNDVLHVLAVAKPPNADGGQQPTAILESHNGGLSFADAPLFVAPANTGILSVEISRSSASTLYVTLYQSKPTLAPLLQRSDNAGQTWQVFDMTGTAGTKPVRIAAVDPVDSSRVYLRAVDDTGAHDALIIATDGGASASPALQLTYPMTGFLRRSNGELLVTTQEVGSYRSADNGQSFQPWLASLHLRGLTERGTSLFLVGDNFKDGFAVARSDDDGASKQTLLQFNQICGLKACGDIPAACQASFSQLSATLQIPDGGCGAPPPKKGCGCGDASGPATAAALFVGLAFLARGLRVSRRSR